MNPYFFTAYVRSGDGLGVESRNGAPGAASGLFLRILARRMKRTARMLLLLALAAGMSAASREPGEKFRDCGECPQMVVAPAGSFSMGSPKGEVGRYAVEEPLHRVEIGAPFAVGTHEVTRKEYGAFAAETGQEAGAGCWFAAGVKWERESASWRNPGYEQTEREPVVCVSWREVQGYVRWLSEKTGVEYRLLSEAEWEYAARAGTETAYGFGDGVSPRRANYGGSGQGQTVPAGSYEPNGYGLYDMHGNAWEWVQDCWNGSYEGAPTDGSAWRRGDCSRRVFRGGSWSDRSRNLRSAHRGRHFSGFRFNNVGFRVARTLAPDGER